MPEPLSGKWAVITRDGCEYCDKVKDLFSEQGINATEFNGDEIPSFRLFLRASGLRTFPQVFHNGVHIGGYDKTAEYIARQIV